jgi:hypothetical protein
VPGPEGWPGTQLSHDRTVSPAASTGSVEPTGDLVGVEAEAAATLTQRLLGPGGLELPRNDGLNYI